MLPTFINLCFFYLNWWWKWPRISPYVLTKYWLRKFFYLAHLIASLIPNQLVVVLITVVANLPRSATLQGLREHLLVQLWRYIGNPAFGNTDCFSYSFWHENPFQCCSVQLASLIPKETIWMHVTYFQCICIVLLELLPKKPSHGDECRHHLCARETSSKH